MGTKTYFGERLTYHYADGYAELDFWGSGGVFHILSASQRIYDEDDIYCERWTRYVRVKAPYGMPRKQIHSILAANYRVSCRCEHDCCGCAYSYVSKIRHLGRREYQVEISYRINC